MDREESLIDFSLGGPLLVGNPEPERKVGECAVDKSATDSDVIDEVKRRFPREWGRFA